jgi:hypothetical protein
MAITINHKARSNRLIEALLRISTSADNKNWRKPELIAEAARAIVSDRDFKKEQARRDDDIQCINSLYGAPGESYDTEDGRNLLCDLLEEIRPFGVLRHLRHEPCRKTSRQG